MRGNRASPGPRTGIPSDLNRNSPGRSGTAEDQVYLCSPSTAAVSAVTGVLPDPRTIDRPPPSSRKPIVERSKWSEAQVLCHQHSWNRGHRISTHAYSSWSATTSPPATDPGRGHRHVALVQPRRLRRLHVPESQPGLPRTRARLQRRHHHRRRQLRSGLIPRARGPHPRTPRDSRGRRRSYARIHRRNLIAVGVVPLVFANEADWSTAEVGQHGRIPGIGAALHSQSQTTLAQVEGIGTVPLELRLSRGEREVLSAGGLQPEPSRASAPSRNDRPLSTPEDRTVRPTKSSEDNDA